MSPHRSALRVAALAFTLYLAVTGVLLLRFEDPAWFIHFGDRSAALELGREVFGPDVPVPYRDGHDGAYFWAQARDPLLLDANETSDALDRPAYRAQRVLYPALSAPWRALGEQGLAVGMVVTNLLVVAAGTYLTARLAVAVGARALFGLLFAVNPATLLSVALDVADALALAGLVGVLLAVHHRRHGLAVLAAVVATLAKEPMLLGVGAVALLCPGMPTRHRLSLVGTPAALAGAWALYVRWRLSWPPSQVEEFTWPFAGWADAYRRIWEPFGDWGNMAVAVLVLLAAAYVLWRWWRAASPLVVASVPFAVLVPFFTAQVLQLSPNIIRAVGPMLTLAAIDLAARRRPAARGDVATRPAALAAAP